MVKCPNCESEVENSRFCPNCGHEIIADEVKNSCPNCGEDVGESKFCPSCGTEIIKENPKSFCPNCGEEVGESAFCPSCGTKIGDEKQQRNCPSCGKAMNDSSTFCPYCGWGKAQEDVKINESKKSSSILGRFASKLNKNKTVDRFFDKTASVSYKNSSKSVDGTLNRKYLEKVEPVFLEVADLIDDDFIKSILYLEREKYNSVDGWGVIGAVATAVNTPTKGMSHDDAVQFYVNLVNDIKNEINQEKLNGNFSEEKFYKKKLKESSLSKLNF